MVGSARAPMDARRAFPCLAAAAAAALMLAGCDRAGNGGDCVAALDDPTPGARTGTCAPSAFEIKDNRWRAVSGRVYDGENPVLQAPLRLEPSVGWQADRAVRPLTTATDRGGLFGPLYEASFNFDLTASIGGALMTGRGIRNRYWEPTIDVPFPAWSPGGSLDLNASVDVAYRTHYDVVFTPPLAASQKVVYFATGEGAVAVTGDATQGLTLVSTSFSSDTTLYAIVYDGADLTSATAIGKTSIVAVSGDQRVLRFAPEPIPRRYDFDLTIKLPPGYTTTSLDVLVTYSRTSRSYVTRMTPGTILHVPNLVDAAEKYLAYRLLARAPDGTEIDSGIVAWGYFTLEGTYELTADLASVVAPVQVAPAEGATLDLAAPLQATGDGVLEHYLDPVAGGPVIRIATAPGDALLPAFDQLGVAPPRGAYTWRTRAFPKSTAVEQLSGRDARRNQPSVWTAPRNVVFP